MEKYHSMERENVLVADPNKSYWVRVNKVTGSLDVCSTDKKHPEFVKKQAQLKRERAAAALARREELKKQRKITKAQAMLRECGVAV